MTGACSILIVEDEDSIAQALSVLLQKDGYTTNRLSNGAKVIENIRAERPNLVLLDAMLPDQSGYEICQELRLDPQLRDVKILIMSARSTEIERRKSLALGADGFLTKPFQATDLRAQIKTLIGAG